jgi:hypothetical protein
MSVTWQTPPNATAYGVVYWINAALTTTPDMELRGVVINTHGAPGALYVGGVNATPITDPSPFSQLNQPSIGTVWINGCDVAAGQNGQAFCSQLARFLGADVVAADDTEWCFDAPFGTIDYFEGTAYRFSPSGLITVYSTIDWFDEGNN